MSKLWYCVEAAHGNIRIAREALEAKGLQVFIDTAITTSNKTKTAKVVPKYGDYLFVCADMNTNLGKSVWTTKGVKNILGGKKYEAQVVPNSVIRTMMALASSEDAIEKGSLVRVIKGTYARYLGTCTHINDSGVLLDIEVFIRPDAKQLKSLSFSRMDVILQRWEKVNVAN